MGQKQYLVWPINGWKTELVYGKGRGNMPHSHTISNQIIDSGKVCAAAAAAVAKSLQSYPTLCDPIDRRPPGSPVPGILQARTLEWVAISFSR